MAERARLRTHKVDSQPELFVILPYPDMVEERGGPFHKGGGKDDQVGYDAGKKVEGRKIHALVDTEGLPMRVIVHSAAIQDRDGAGLVLDKIRRRFPWLELIWADGRLQRSSLTLATRRTTGLGASCSLPPIPARVS
jgi:hypothetical protein